MEKNIVFDIYRHSMPLERCPNRAWYRIRPSSRLDEGKIVHMIQIDNFDIILEKDKHILLYRGKRDSFPPENIKNYDEIEDKHISNLFSKIYDSINFKPSGSKSTKDIGRDPKSYLFEIEPQSNFFIKINPYLWIEANNGFIHAETLEKFVIDLSKEAFENFSEFLDAVKLGAFNLDSVYTFTSPIKTDFEVYGFSILQKKKKLVGV